MSQAHYAEVNRRRWNELTAIHEHSDFYDVAGFKAGKSSLRPLEEAELGDVAGKSLLHLQCHFGLDTLSWARKGARVTGVDFAEKAIDRARSLAAEVGLAARFLCSEVYDLPKVLPETFDIVFTSYGALCWLADLPRWGRLVAHHLRPGGTFYIAELHPMAFALDDRAGARQPLAYYRYFHSPEPTCFESQSTYADRNAVVENRTEYVWTHSLADIVTAMLGAGLRLEMLHEHPYCVCAMTPYMERGADGWFRLPGGVETVPLLFSLKASRPG
jgi:2-polyprenyl-3-methyl-5-hydroxy-6-metoxy-1,4-benzoquinol methylase